MTDFGFPPFTGIIVTKVTGLVLNDRGLNLGRGKDFSPRHQIQTGSGAHQWAPGSVSLE